MREARPKQLQGEGVAFTSPTTGATDARDAAEAVCESSCHSCFGCCRLRFCSIPQEFLFGVIFFAMEGTKGASREQGGGGGGEEEQVVERD